MCGIVFVAGDLDKIDLNMFKTLLFVDTLRGDHSTGVLSVDFKRKTILKKEAVSGPEFIDNQNWEPNKGLNRWNNTLLLGHNRFATKGKVDEDNAHPFEHGDIIGVHNGTLSKGSVDLLNKGLDQEYGTDSETFYAYMAKHGLKEALKRVHGSFVFIWYNKADHTLNIIRNSKRTFFFRFLEGGKTFIGASESAFIDITMNKCKRTTEKGMFYPKDSVVYTVKLAHKAGALFDNQGELSFTSALNMEEVIGSIPVESSYNEDWWKSRRVNYTSGRAKSESKDTATVLPFSCKSVETTDSKDFNTLVTEMWSKARGKALKRYARVDYLSHLLRTCPGKEPEADKLRKELARAIEEQKRLGYLAYKEKSTKLMGMAIEYYQESLYKADLIGMYTGTDWHLYDDESLGEACETAWGPRTEDQEKKTAGT